MFKNMVYDLEETAGKMGERTAFFTDSRSVTYQQLADLSRRSGTAIARFVPPGSKIALMIRPGSLDNVSALYGTLYAGCAYAPLDISLPAGLLAEILDRLKPDLIVADQAGRDVCERLWKGQDHPRAGLLSMDEATRQNKDDILLQERMQAVKPDDMMSVFFTSGSTGVPKGAVQTQGAYRAWTEATIEKYGLSGQVCFGNQSPFFYANSIIDIFPPVALGASVCLLPPGVLNFPRDFVQCMNRNHITELTMTPSSFAKIAQAGVLEPGIFPELKWCISSGESLPRSVMEAWAQAAPGADWWHFYGSTEMFSVSAGCMDKETIRKHREGAGQDDASDGCLPSGKPFDQVQVLLLREDGTVAAAGETGEILVSSPWVSRGYYADPSRTASFWVKDPAHTSDDRFYYRSGDLGFFRTDGQLVVTGRKDTQIKHGGYRMEIGQVEQKLSEIPGISFCVLYQKQTGKLWCFYAGDLSEKELKRTLKASLARYMLPDEIRRLDQMPLTSRMKTDRAALFALME